MELLKTAEKVFKDLLSRLQKGKLSGTLAINANTEQRGLLTTLGHIKLDLQQTTNTIKGNLFILYLQALELLYTFYK